MKVIVDDSDLAKIQDVLVRVSAYHRLRDQMNAHLHLATEVRYSPLTSELQAAMERMDGIVIEEVKE